MSQKTKSKQRAIVSQGYVFSEKRNGSFTKFMHFLPLQNNAINKITGLRSFNIARPTKNKDGSYHVVLTYGPVKGAWKSDIERWVQQAIAEAFVDVEFSPVSSEYTRVVVE